MSFKTASAILRGRWLIDKDWTQQHLPLVLRLAKGEEIDFGGDKDVDPDPKSVLSNKSASVYGVTYYTDISRLPTGSIVMMDINGPITKYGDVCAWGSVDHVATLERLGNAPNVAGIIINIDSPGGEVTGTQMLADAVKNAGGQKPVVAFINDGIAASAAMWIASAANEIYTAQRTDAVGSVGVYTTIADWYGYFEKQGLQVRDIYAPQSTEKNLDYREALKGNDEPVKEDLALIADQFIGAIKNNRGGKLTSNDWQTGKMFYSKEAARIGLTDGQKSFNQLVRRMNTLIQQKQNSNTMAFEKTLSAAKAESFEVVDGGFLVTEEDLNNIEASLAATETIANDLNAAEMATESAAEELIIVSSNLVTANTRIAELEAENAKLKKADGQKPSGTAAGEDPKNGSEKTGWDKYHTSVDDEAAKMRAFVNS